MVDETPKKEESAIPWRIFPACENCKHWEWEEWILEPDYTGFVGKGYCELHNEKTLEHECCENWEDRWRWGLRMRSWKDKWQGIRVELRLGGKTRERTELGERRNHG